jgi:uncharacterized protein YndB with AHSA1/START domain
MQRQKAFFTTDISINAPIQKIWEALTVSSFISQYIGTSVDSDWREGSKITYRDEWEGKVYESKGVILEVKPPHLLKQRFLSELSRLEDKPENYQIITASLTERDGAVVAAITVENVRDEFFQQRTPEIWGELLSALKDITEK